MVNMKHNLIKLTAVLFFVFTAFSFSQDKIVTEYLQQYAQGKMNEVRGALPDLIVEYPNDPGVKLLLAVVLEDADRAVDIYKEIIQKYPESQWADDAYWRLLEYYAVKGDVEKAEYELNNFRKRYPTSEFLSPATDVVRTAKSIAAAKNKKEKEVEQVDQTSKATKNDEKKEQVADENPKSTNKTYGLQVGIYTTLEAAEAEKEKFLKQRLRTTIEEKVVDGTKKYAVVIGNYSSMESAEAAKQIIQQQCGCKPLIYQK
jgi:cell division protein FtsN